MTDEMVTGIAPPGNLQMREKNQINTEAQGEMNLVMVIIENPSATKKDSQKVNLHRHLEKADAFHPHLQEKLQGVRLSAGQGGNHPIENLNVTLAGVPNMTLNHLLGNLNGLKETLDPLLEEEKINLLREGQVADLKALRSPNRNQERMTPNLPKGIDGEESRLHRKPNNPQNHHREGQEKILVHQEK